MNDDVTSVELAGKNTLKVFFRDGKCGWVDFSDLIEKYPEYSPLRDPELFGRFSIDPEIKALCWPGDIDIAPETLYHLATGEPLPEWMELEVESK
jgi:hypothetical protein